MISAGEQLCSPLILSRDSAQTQDESLAAQVASLQAAHSAALQCLQQQTASSAEQLTAQVPGVLPNVLSADDAHQAVRAFAGVHGCTDAIRCSLASEPCGSPLWAADSRKSAGHTWQKVLPHR